MTDKRTIKRRTFILASLTAAPGMATGVHLNPNQRTTKGFVVKAGVNRFQETTKIGKMNPVDIKVSTKGTEGALDKLSAEACLSPRAFEKRFLQQVGVTPKYFARICRFWQAYKQKKGNPQLDWLSLALANGYTDYQHLAKDFRQFAGVTPTRLIAQTAQDSEHLLRLKPEIR